MSYARDEVADFFAIDAAADERALFIRRTYSHLCGAILGFMAIEAAILSNDALALSLTQLMLGHWWIALLAFMGVGWLAERWAESGTSRTTQYVGLAVYTVAEAIIFVPLLTIASKVAGPNVIPNAAIITAFIFGGLTAMVLFTKADFSFLRGALCIGGFAALGLIFAAMIFGFSLGLWFPAGMVVLMSGYILYYTSSVLHHYRTDQYVAASLALFACVATLFWYVVQLVASLSGDD